MQRQLRDDPSLIPAAVDEYLRLLTPYRGFARTPTRDVEIRGRLIRKDEPVAVVFASANRDEDVFPEPDRFVLDRPNIRQHVAFGLGPHRCAGAPLGTLMLRLTLEELLAPDVARSRSTGEPAMTALARVGNASSVPGAPCSLTSTRSTRDSSKTRTRPGRGCAASAPSRAARAGTSGR